MIHEAELLQTVRRRWEYPGEDEDFAHGIYREDAVLEFPSPANGSKACGTSGNGGGSTPRSLSSPAPHQPSR